MDPVSQRDALRVIQEIVSREKGGPLGTAGVRELETVLAGLASAGAQIPSAAAGYSCHEATIVFADLRGFSAIAARHPPEVVLAELDRYFGRMVEIIAAHHGAVDKFIGDAIMAVFHADPALPGDHARRAVLCAIEMQLAMRELGAQARSMAALYLGIGISTGPIMAGVIGSQAYRAYMVVGEEVNLAARIEALSLRGQILMSEATFEQVKDTVHAGEPMELHVKGRGDVGEGEGPRPRGRADGAPCQGAGRAPARARSARHSGPRQGGAAPGSTQKPARAAHHASRLLVDRGQGGRGEVGARTRARPWLPWHARGAALGTAHAHGVEARVRSAVRGLQRARSLCARGVHRRRGCALARRPGIHFALRRSGGPGTPLRTDAAAGRLRWRVV